jgi:hypothetical protein
MYRGEGNPFYGQKHTDETREVMRDVYTDERREIIGSLNRGKTLPDETREAIRLAALARAPMSAETRNKVSANSAKTLVFLVSKPDNVSFLHDGVSVTSISLATINAVATFLNVNEKTVRRATKGKGTLVQTQTRNVGLSLKDRT